MKKIIPIVVCAVLLISVKSECDDEHSSNCIQKIVTDILKDTTVVENIDIQLQVPKFKQIKNVGIEDLNQILVDLTSWFESRLKDSNFIFKHVSNNTKIFVKSFDFNVDFEKGNAKIDVDLTEEPNDKKKINQSEVQHDDKYEINYFATENANEKVTKETTTAVITTTAATKTEENKVKTDKIDRIIDKLGSEKENEIFKLEEFDTSYVDEGEDNSTDYPILDYVEIYKDTTNEENTYTATELSTAIEDIITGIYEIERNFTETNVSRTENVNEKDTTCPGNATCRNFTESVFPWVVTIFVTNNTKDSQFSYYCDGALLTEKVIVTGARCMVSTNKTWEPQNVLVFLGKANLQSFGGNEKVHKVKDIVIHPKFAIEADGKVVNDLALLVVEEAVEYKNNIQSACIHPGDSGVDESATTAWGLNGTLEPIFFNKEKNMYCFNKDEDIFCATYGNEVALCPSYGGVYASRLNDRWCLQGIFYGDPIDRTFCFSKDVYYTSLKNYVTWIDETVGLYKNYPL